MENKELEKRIAKLETDLKSLEHSILKSDTNIEKLEKLTSDIRNLERISKINEYCKKFP